jgi:hypothetical protein
MQHTTKGRDHAVGTVLTMNSATTLMTSHNNQKGRVRDHAVGTVSSFRQTFTLEDAIEFHAFVLLEAPPCT